MVADSSLECHPQLAASTRTTPVEMDVKNNGSNNNDADNTIKTGMEVKFLILRTVLVAGVRIS